MIQKFRKFATLHNVHVTLVIHPRKEDDERLTANSIFGGAKATQESDNVIILQEEEINLKVKRKFIQVERKSVVSNDKDLSAVIFSCSRLSRTASAVTSAWCRFSSTRARSRSPRRSSRGRRVFASERRPRG